MDIQAFIKTIITEPTKEPMTLFVSYAHREALICRLIVYALKARGHKVWFDELNIPHGSDWRTAILRGIEDSEGVLAMISNEAVKPGGVCLDELSIAVGVRGGNIRTVLLEQNVMPPPTIMYRQWIDFTEWQEFKEDDVEKEELFEEPAFIEWFKEKIAVLIAMLETRENREFEGQLTTIKNALPAFCMSTSQQMFLLKEFHVERTWLREKTEKWLDDPNGDNICVIYGEPGIGKSAFAAHYAHYNGRVAAAIFCEKGQNTLNSPEVVIQTLAYMLACRIADYREYLADLLGNRKTIEHQCEKNDDESVLEVNPFAQKRYEHFESTVRRFIGSMNADEMFEILLAVPLLSLIDGARPVECILVDGLDEAGDLENNELAYVLQKYAGRLPKWLRLLILSRRISAVQKWLGNACHLDLATGAQENRADLERFVQEELKSFDADSEIKKKAATSIVLRSDGVFLYAKMVLNAIKEGKVSLEETDAFPHGLDQIFLRWFEWYFPNIDKYNEKIRPALNLILASPEPIPKEEIIAVTGWKRQQLGEFERLIQILICENNDVSDAVTIDFSHSFIREWIESSAAGEYQIFVDDGIIELAAFFGELLSDNEPQINEYEALHMQQITERAAILDRSMRRLNKEVMQNEALMRRQEELGLQCWKWNRLTLAYQYLQNALRIAECRTNNEDDAENWKHVIICKNRLAKVEGALGHTDAEKTLNEGALAIARKNLDKRGLPEDMRRAAVSIMVAADSLAESEKALDYYHEAKNLLLQAAEQDDDDEIFRNLAIVYNRIGMISARRKDYAMAASSFFEDLQISQRLAMKTGKPEARRDFAVSCYKLAGVYTACGEFDLSKNYYKLALQTIEYLVKDQGQPDDIRGFIVLLNSRGKFISGELLPSYEKALGLSRQLVSKYGMKRDYLYTADSLTNIGIELFYAGNQEGAKERWIEAYDIYKRYGAVEANDIKKRIQECER